MAQKVGYGTFVKNGADGMTNQVGQNALNTKDKPVNKIIYADNTTNHLDGNFHGQRLNDVVLNYDANKYSNCYICRKNMESYYR